MWKRILAYFLIILGLLVTLFFRKYTGELIPYPFLFWLTGLALLAGGLYLLRNSLTRKEKNQQQKLAEAVNHLKLNGEKIIVDFAECEIKSNKYVEERATQDSKNELPWLIESEIERYSKGLGQKTIQVSVNQSAIIFPYKNIRTGDTERFVSRLISKDEITLSFYLDRQKTTTLYVDKANRNSYYFDLDFLND